MKKAAVLLVLLACMFLTAPPASAVVLNDGGSVTFSTSSGNLAASATFSLSGGILTVVLTNTSLADVLIPSDVLTALFFNIVTNPLLTSGTAVLTAGSTVFFDTPPAGGVVGGEWGYKNNLGLAGFNEGISSAGFGLFGGATFAGADLSAPAALNGLNYGLLSAGDNTATGNAPVTGGVEGLIQNSVTFTLSGAGSSLDINNVAFQYGTALTEPRLVPEPATILLLGSGLLGTAGVRRFLRRRG